MLAQGGRTREAVGVPPTSAWLTANSARIYAALPAVLAVAAAAVLVAGFLVVAFKWEIYPGEAINSYFASSLVHGGDLYLDWTPLTPYFPVYPPGFYWLVAPLELLDENSIWPGRLLSMIATVLAGWAAWRIALRLGCNRVEAIASAIAFVSIGVTNQLVAAARPDMVGIGLAALALLAATRWEDDRDRLALYGAAALTAGFVVVKYNFAPLGLAIAASFWLRDRGAAVRYAVASVGLTLLAFLIADVASSGAFLSNTRDFGNGYALTALRDVVKPTLEPFPNPLLVVAGVEAALGVALGWRRARSVHLAWFASLLIILSAVKIGSATNYVAPTALVSSVLLGPALMRARLSFGQAAAATASVALALSLAPATYELVRGVPDLRNRLSSLDSAYAEAAARIAAAPGPVFGDRNDLTIEAGKGPSFDNAAMTLLWQSGEWDTEPLIQRIEQRQLGVVQSSFDLFGSVPVAHGTPAWPLDLVAAIRAAYCPVWMTPGSGGGAVWLYRPCNNPPSQSIPLPAISGEADGD
jgi:hypothetical protein